MDDTPRSTKTTLLTASRRWVAPVAASAGIALALAAAIDFINRSDAPPRAAKSPAANAAVPTLMSKDRPLPRYVVGIRRPGSAVVVRDVRTFAQVGTVPAPANRRLQQVATAGPNSYVVSASARNGTVFYRLWLAPDGKPGVLTPVPRVRVPGTSTMWSDLAISKDGGTIASVSYRARKPAIDTVALATGARRTWTTSNSGRIGALSWAGQTLSFVWSPTRGATVIQRQVRTLDITRPGGDLKVSRPVLTLPAGADTAVMSRDGTTIVTGISGRSGLTLAAYSAADGRQTKVLWQRPGGPFRVTRLVPDSAGGDVIAGASDGRLIVAPAHGAADFTAADIADLSW